MNTSFEPYRQKMAAAGVAPASVEAFARSFEKLAAGESAMIPESAIEPVRELPARADLPVARASAAELLGATVVVKLNGGLGTGMGLERAKSLVNVREGLNFLDLIARQILHLREKHRRDVRFLVMNSFATSADTLAQLGRYPELGAAAELELMQGKVPKVDAATLLPAESPGRPELEWCPPGHGDLYPSLLGSGRLERLLEEGVIYAFVSNSDNLGATLDLDLLEFFASSGKSFLMEVTERTPSDRKGGHLALSRDGGNYLLRESAQCPRGDLESFQDIERHRFFNTNNLWVRLDRLAEVLGEAQGVLPLPVIQNSKTLDPRDPHSPPVYQLETAMGAAIECFPESGAVVVPRSRLSPVKTTSDLFALRSDAYELTGDACLRLRRERSGVPPAVALDGAHYGQVDQLERALALGVPSLIGCRRLGVRGPVTFSGDNIITGEVEIVNQGSEPKTLPAGEIRDTTLSL
ncbi:MAG: UTP--glucose-1-phosphate uridylyltransferase [Verrucomicrobiales bacterium]